MSGRERKPQKNIEKEALAQVFSSEFCEICKNTVFYRTALVAATVVNLLLTLTGIYHVVLFIQISTCTGKAYQNFSNFLISKHLGNSSHFSRIFTTAKKSL